MNKIKLSIIVPVYNTLPYLKDCFDSIANQTFEDYEVVIVDDGSTDGSADYIEEYIKKHNKFVCVHQQNSGASVARNTGICKACGEYIHFIDSDDRLSNCNVYTNIFSNIDSNHADIIFARSREYNEDYLIEEKSQPEYKQEGNYNGDILFDVLKSKYEFVLTSPVNKIFRRELIVDNNVFFCENLDHEEDEWLPKIFVNANQVIYNNSIIYDVRHRRGSLSEINTEENRERKAESKVFIAVSGMRYMEDKCLPVETMALVAEHYWGYMIDAILTVEKLQNEGLKDRLLYCIKSNKAFFQYKHYLKNRNWRTMGTMMQTIGIKNGARIMSMRYHSK